MNNFLNKEELEKQNVERMSDLLDRASKDFNNIDYLTDLLSSLDDEKLLEYIRPNLGLINRVCDIMKDICLEAHLNYKHLIELKKMDE
jgi:hypothetical protein